MSESKKEDQIQPATVYDAKSSPPSHAGIECGRNLFTGVMRYAAGMREATVANIQIECLFNPADALGPIKDADGRV